MKLGADQRKTGTVKTIDLETHFVTQEWVDALYANPDYPRFVDDKATGKRRMYYPLADFPDRNERELRLVLPTPCSIAYRLGTNTMTNWCRLNVNRSRYVALRFESSWAHSPLVQGPKKL